jgi:Cu/Ag efflux protein CusF
MNTITKFAVALSLSLASVAYAADDVVSAVRGTVDKVDSASKTVVVKTADGTKHSLHLVKTTTVHGTDAAAKDSWHGLKEGSEVVAHYTKNGADETALEIDHVGKDGLKATKGTIKEFDRGGKKIVVVTADGTEETFHLRVPRRGPRWLSIPRKTPARRSLTSSRKSKPKPAEPEFEKRNDISATHWHFIDARKRSGASCTAAPRNRAES